MKRIQTPELIWLDQPFDQCPISGESIYATEVEVTLLGEPSILVDWVLGRCEHSNRWYGLLIDLLALLEEEEHSMEAVDGFLLDGEKAQAGIWIGPPAEVAPWAFAREQLGRLMAPPPSGPPPEPDEVRALPLLSESWELAVRPASWYLDEEDAYVPTFIALVLDPASGIRRHDLKGETPHAAPELARLVLEAAARPSIGQPGRPQEVRIEDDSLAETLAKTLAEAAISLRAAPTPMANHALDEMQATLGGGAPEPFFTTHDAKDVRAFFRAAKAFCRARPWDRIEADKFIAFRLGDGPWAYLNVMGQMGEEYGISVFEDWLHLCRFIHNQPSPWDYAMDVGQEKAFAAAGAMESMSLGPLPLLHPEDAQYVRQLGIKPVWKGLYASVQRFTLEGLERPHLSLPAYRALMAALAEVLAKRRARTITSIKQTITVGKLPVTLRYPAKGNEPFEDHPPGSFRLVISGLDEGPKARSGVTRIEVDAPGDARVDKVGRAIKRACGESFWLSGIASGEHALWSEHFGRGAPCPRVAHLASIPSLAMEFLASPYPMQMMPRMGPKVEEIQVKCVGR